MHGYGVNELFPEKYIYRLTNHMLSTLEGQGKFSSSEKM